MMSVRDLRVRFGDVTVLRLDKLDLRENETVGVVGPNGSGKSTLLRVLAGLLLPTSGNIRNLPRPGQVVLVHQEPYFFTGSVRDNLVYALRLAGLPAAAAETWMQRAQAEHLADRPAGTLSVGERRRLAIARALAVAPQLLLVDEPLAALDAVHRDIIMNELADFTGTLVVAGPTADGLGYDRIVNLPDVNFVGSGPGFL